MEAEMEGLRNEVDDDAHEALDDSEKYDDSRCVINVSGSWFDASDFHSE